MPNLPSAKKELRKNVVRNAKNSKVKAELKKLLKKTDKAIVAKDEKAKELLRESLQAIDKAAKKRILKPNTRDRKKSRLHARFNKVFAVKTK
ncbi:MAG: 30S ribosomal protein S20 [Patescibacteria group bacterium]|jgi:small subunit ribosomal protein S20